MSGLRSDFRFRLSVMVLIRAVEALRTVAHGANVRLAFLLAHEISANQGVWKVPKRASRA